ncbi:MAG TPA: hypothetical protein VGV87_09390, partial [Blastocatellia bacterium]|nr:hypothetical protein [Blastocatellia bacterium]
MKLMSRSVFSVLAFSLMFAWLATSSHPAVRAQTPAPPPPPGSPQISPQSMPPDRKAYMDANRLPDPQKKIAALQKFLADFPKSQMLYSAHASLMSALIKNAPEQKENILLHAQKAIDAAPEFIRKVICNQVATELIEGGVLLDKAEEFAAKALSMAEQEQAKAMRQSRASYQTIMGRIYLKKGKTKEAEKAFKAAYNAVPAAEANSTTLRTAALGLAEIAEKEGKYDQAFAHLSAAAIYGRIDASARARLETAYRKTHQDSLAGLDEMLDAKYEKEFPSPIKVEPYKPTPSRTERTVLSEVFTGSGCPPCVAADLAFDAFLERYRNKDVIVMMYHQHIPLPDPMTNPSSQARAKYYSVRGVPSFAIDGDSSQSGGGSRTMAVEVYDRLSPFIEKQLEAPAEAEIKLNLDVTGPVVKITANVANVKRDSGQLRLQLGLVEESLRFNGENGIRFHPMVVRSLAGENAAGFALDRSKLGPVEWRFDLTAITEELKKHLDEFEKSRSEDKYTFA